MATTTFTRSIEIDAPVSDVFAFVEDPERLFTAWPMAVSVGNVELAAGGVGSRYEWTGGKEWGVTLSGTIHRDAYVPGNRIVDRSSTGSTWRWSVQPEGSGTRLTVTVDHSARRLREGLDTNVMRMTGRDLEDMLSMIREKLERR
jgi:carbon monoxide dehydrogenase subunit G